MQIFSGNRFRWVSQGVVPSLFLILFCLFVVSKSFAFFFVFLRSSIVDSVRGRQRPPEAAGGRRRPLEARGGQLFSLEQPAVHLAGWDPMQREGQADFFPGGQLASWRPAGLQNAKVALPPGDTRPKKHSVALPIVLPGRSTWQSPTHLHFARRGARALSPT